VDWIYLADDRDKQRAVANMIINFQIPQNIGDFFIGLGIVRYLS
jgi:hypothetical protein